MISTHRTAGTGGLGWVPGLSALLVLSDQVKWTFFFTKKRAGWCGLTGGPLANGQIVQGFHAEPQADRR